METPSQVALKVLSKSEGGIELYSNKYYLTCMVGGIFSCGLTHAAVTPLDLMKCRVQADPGNYPSIMGGFRTTLAKEGFRGLWVGLLPTAIGYSMQGACKFGFYEIFKRKYAVAVGEEAAEKYKTILFLAASASAEVIADVALCPMEAVKVRMQTDASFSRSLMPGVNAILKNEGMSGFYKGVVPLWMRQVPYTMMKFGAFENTVRAIYRALPKPREQYNYAEQLGVTFLGGYIAGVFCAVVSHPADTLVSQLNKTKTEGGTGAAVKEIIGRVGFGGLWAGLGARIIMIGTLTGLQWFIYDSYKAFSGLPTTGGEKKKVSEEEKQQ